MLLFVYGSLKRGFELHTLLERELFLGAALTVPHYRLFDVGNYPCLVDWPEGLAIEGEVYDVHESTIPALDAAECVDLEWYVRRPILLQPPFDDREVLAYFWLKPVSGFRSLGATWPE